MSERAPVVALFATAFLAACRTAPRAPEAPLPFHGDARALAALVLAREHAGSGAFEEGIALAREVVAARPDEPIGHRVLQDLLVRAGRIEEARREAAAALARERDPRTLVLAARLEADPESAELLVREALAVDPEDGPALHALAALGATAWTPEEGIRALRRAVEALPAFAPARVSLAARLEETGDVEGAAGAWEEAVRLDPGDPDARYGLGLSRLRRGDPKGAEKEFRAGWRVVPEDPEVLLGIGAALLERGHGRRAAEVYAALERLAPDDPRVAFSLGVLRQEHLGDPRGALEAYRRALALPRDRREGEFAMRLRARLWAAELERALEAATRPSG